MEFIKKLFALSFVRFAFVGGIASLIHYGVYLALLQLNLNLSLTYVMAFCVSLTCNYLLSSYFTFHVKPQWARAFKFLTAHLVNLFNELVLLNVFLYFGVSKYYAPLGVFLVAFPINYFMVRFALKGIAHRRTK
ncbi:MAG: GtrA family protein [Alistipes sp.]